MPEWAGKADIARYEILNKVGGIFIDADSKFFRLIDDSLLDDEAFCCFENESIRPSLLSNGYLGTAPGSELTKTLIQAIKELSGTDLHPDAGRPTTNLTEAWKSTGPILLTKAVRKIASNKVRIYPSFFFIPNHYLISHPSAHYKGPFKPYCDSLWGSTPGSNYSYAYQENQTKQPLVSICTITSDRERFLPLLMKCIDQQNYPPERLEWVILDDSITYPHKIELASQLRIKIKYQRASNKITLGRKRNIAHKLCSGEIIVYMDDDDFYSPSRVRHAVKTLQKSGLGVAASTTLPIYFTHDNQLWVSGPFGKNHGTAGTFAMTRDFAREHSYSNEVTCNEERDFLKDYTIPLAQLNPELTMICISHSRNTFDKKRMRLHGATPRMRPAHENEFLQLLTCFSPEEYIVAANSTKQPPISPLPVFPQRSVN